MCRFSACMSCISWMSFCRMRVGWGGTRDRITVKGRWSDSTWWLALWYTDEEYVQLLYVFSDKSKSKVKRLSNFSPFPKDFLSAEPVVNHLHYVTASYDASAQSFSIPCPLTLFGERRNETDPPPPHTHKNTHITFWVSMTCSIYNYWIFGHYHLLSSFYLKQCFGGWTLLQTSVFVGILCTSIFVLILILKVERRLSL